MRSEERGAIDNGIWMCRTHAKLIDSDEATYTVELLEQWRCEAEARAERRLRGASAAALTASRLYGTPRAPSLKFVGRQEEISQLQELLLHTDAVRIAASVEGLPGIGKTELALQLVFQLAHDGVFPGGIFWFNAEDPDLLPTWGGAIADALSVAPGSLEQRAAEVLRTVRQASGATLLVLDNVDVWSSERQPGPLPEGTHLRYLVTTRQRRLGGARFEHVEVGFRWRSTAATRSILRKTTPKDHAQTVDLGEPRCALASRLGEAGERLHVRRVDHLVGMAPRSGAALRQPVKVLCRFGHDRAELGAILRLDPPDVGDLGEPAARGAIARVQTASATINRQAREPPQLPPVGPQLGAARRSSTPTSSSHGPP